MRLLLSLVMSLAVGAFVLVIFLGRGERNDLKQPSAPVSVIPKLTPSETQAQSIQKLDSTSLSPDEASKTEGYLYRWRDANGTIHIQSKPPGPELQATRITYQKQKVEKVEAQAKVTPPPASKQHGLLAKPLSVYTPEGFEQLLDTVEETADKLQDRNQVLEKLSKDL